MSINRYVLRPPRSASSNSMGTGDATSGVDRDHKVPSGIPAGLLPTGKPPEPLADIYQAAVLLKTSLSEEYLLWAANTGSFTTIEDLSFSIEGTVAGVSLLPGTLTVGLFTDGTGSFVVRDSGGRTLYEVTLLTLKRGDTSSEITFGALGTFPFSSQDPTGKVTLTSAGLLALGGGFSRERGDEIVSVYYVLSRPRFWFTRNDPSCTRFGYNGTAGRWEALKGTTPSNVGTLSSGSLYTLNPPPSRFQVGGVLPGNPSNGDEFALIRVGVAPDSGARSPEVLVVTDEAASSTYPFPGSSPEAVMGVTSGVLQFNPAFIDSYAGLPVWYSAETFPKDSSGELGKLTEANVDPYYLCPVPHPFERPMVRFGSRTHLTALPFNTDAALPAPSSLSEGEFAWSRTTGKLVFSDADVQKASPGEVSYEVPFLGTLVFYDGVSINSQPLPLKNPVALVDSSGNASSVISGDMYVPLAVPAPFPGTSGVRYLPDGTGATPNLITNPTTRVNGNTTGLVREVLGIGDAFVFSSSKTFEDLEVVEYDEDLDTFSFGMRKNLAQISRQALTSTLSRVQFKRSGISGEPIYFQQADVIPALWADEAKIYSRFQGPFTLTGSETFRFSIGNTLVTWTAGALTGTLTAGAVASSLQAAITTAGAPGTCYAQRDYLVLQASSPTGKITIGWNADPDDLSGQSVLGFLPGWRVDLSGTLNRWLPVNGSSIGVSRSPLNLDGSGDEPDLRATGFFSGVLTENIPETPTFLITNPPLLDFPGYTEDSHFASAKGLSFAYLENWDQVLYEFQDNRFSWITTFASSALSVSSPAWVLPLGMSGALPETLSPLALLDDSYGLRYKTPGGAYGFLTEGTDYVFQDDGGSGVVNLTTVYGGEVLQGGAGYFTSGSLQFRDLNVASWASELGTSLVEGFRLALRAGDAIGSYLVTGIDADPAVLLIEPSIPFPAGAGPLAGEAYVSWELFEGIPSDQYDPSIVADVVQEEFIYGDETFLLKVLSLLGSVPEASYEAALSDALTSGRGLSLRFGVGHSDPAATLTLLKRGISVGTLASTGLKIPVLANSHYLNGSFSIRIGEASYEGASLVGVTSFPPLIVGDVVYYGLPATGIEGQLRFGGVTLSSNEGAAVVFDELLDDPSDILAGEAEADPVTGEVQISSSDSSLYAGADLYLVEGYVLGEDYQTSPLTGGTYLQKPLRAGQIVEASYYQAKTDGSRDDTVGLITEYLSNVIRLETATLVSSDEYSFNPSGKTVDSQFPAAVWVGAQLQNYAGRDQVSVSGSSLLFTYSVPSSAAVRLNYAVLEASGGEQSYSTSVYPFYRPPFFLLKNQSTFLLEGDRTGEFSVGQLFTVGTVPYWIKGFSYDAGENKTSVEIWPPREQEVGSRSPGNDLPARLAYPAIALSVDGVPAGGSAGYLLSLPTASYLPMNRGALSVTFAGDLTGTLTAGKLLEIGGYPFLIGGSQLINEGRYTEVSVASPSPTGLSMDDGEAVFITARPVYGVLPLKFKGLPLLGFESYELVRFGLKDENGSLLPGRTLVPDADYTVDPSTGVFSLKTPAQSGLLSGERLIASFYEARVVGPSYADNVLTYPLYKSKYKYRSLPGGYAGGTLIGRYTYKAPDSFYFQVLPMEEYMGEVAQIALQRIAGQSPSGGAVQTYPGALPLSAQGSFGLRAQLQDLRDQDRAARSFVLFYNEIIVYLEQILENIDGRVIGDRDGKFRFLTGSDFLYPPPGWEDPFSGNLNVRNLWSDVFTANNPDRLLAVITDPIVDPTTAEATDPDRPGQPDGETPSPSILEFFIQQQAALVQNDIDDLLLIGLKSPALAAFATAFPLLPTFAFKGEFKKEWEPHRFSRLFPEATKGFTITMPGIGANLEAGNKGFYSAGRLGLVPGKEPGTTDLVLQSTLLQPIGTISNPALGVIEGIQDASYRPRKARARIWKYSATGFSDIDGSYPSEPSLIATPLPFSQFPLDPDTGYPDRAQLKSGGGEKYDLATGDPELFTPAFEVGQPLGYGRTNGNVYALGDSGNQISSYLSGGIPLSSPVFAGVYVKDILDGMVIVLGKQDGSSLSGGSILVIESNTPFLPEQGDTIYVVPDAQNKAAETMSDPPLAEELSALSETFPNYREGFDLGIREGLSQLRDLTLPSKDDPSVPLKELLGQNPPGPMTTVEGDVTFSNTRRFPAKLPALLGKPQDDSGDVQIPYLATETTELNLLGELSAQMRAFIGADSTVPLPVPAGVPANETQIWKAIYPDEIRALDGTILTGGYVGTQSPATLYTSQDLFPVGVYSDRSAIGNLRPWDLLLVQTANQPASVTPGITGILTVGNADTGFIEVPRFVTPTNRGDLFKYTLTNAFVSTKGGGSFGVQVTSTPVGADTYTTFNFSSNASFILNDGSGAATGGLNNFYGTNNAVLVRIYSPTTGLLLEAITLYGGTAFGTVSSPAGIPITVTASSLDYSIGLQTTGTLSSVANSGLYYDVTITVDTYIDSDTRTAMNNSVAVGAGAGSSTGGISRDRLTFNERFSLKTSAPRGTGTFGDTVQIETRLAVYEVTVGGASGCTVNAPNAVNNGVAFSFLERFNTSTFLPYTGTWSAATGSGAGDENGTLKVMSWETNGNTLLPSDVSDLIFSAVPSSDVGPSAVIFDGTGRIPDQGTAGRNSFCWVQNLSSSSSLVQSGDIVVVDEGAAGGGCVKNGTYLVRHALDGNTAALDTTPLNEFTSLQLAGGGNLKFPRLLSFVNGGGSSSVIVIEDVDYVYDSPNGTPFASSGFLYFVLKNQVASLNGGSWDVDASSVYRASYASAPSYDPTTGRLTFTVTTYRDALGAVLTRANFQAGLSRGVKISGMQYAPFVNLSPLLPANNLVGYYQTATGAGAIAGAAQVVFKNLSYSTSTGVTYAAGADLLIDTATAAGDMGVHVPVGEDSRSFYDERSKVVYPLNTTAPASTANPIGVISYFDLSKLTWDDVNFGAGTPVTGGHIVKCLLPGGSFELQFSALAGIFLEPSFPRPVTNLGITEPHLVSRAETAAALSRIGIRNFYEYFNPAPPPSYEDVHLYVRRIRRFHEVQTQIMGNLELLKPVYETRRGAVQTYSSRTVTANTGVYGEATNIGSFSEALTNINPGDEFRLLSASGDLLESVPVEAVISGTELRLARPGLQTSSPAGKSFEIYLKKAPVPHEQSLQQLLTSITDEVVVTRSVDYTTPAPDGGRAPDFNLFSDDDPALLLGVQAGDYLVVDPAGDLFVTGEVGARPEGDQSVVDRLAPIYVPSRPSALDDNRGFYKITDASDLSNIVVEGTSKFGGSLPDGSDDVVFGPAGNQYSVLPTVHASLITGVAGPEGQQSLRPTASAVGGSFSSRTGNDQYKSIQPFPYRVIRMKSAFSEDFVELVLFMRERMLSWIEELSLVQEINKGGDYWTFQDEDHLEDLGNPTSAIDGLGVMSNSFLTSITGLTQYAPFANVGDCLSILDRRFWILDTRLDGETPPSSPTAYSDLVGGVGRPVLPDLIDDVLDYDDRFRDLRYSWVQFRTDRVEGSLPALKRGEELLLQRLEEQRNYLLLKKSLG